MNTIDYISIPLFKSLDRLDVARLVPSLQICTMETGETLFRQGDKGDELYIIVDGRVSIRKNIGGEDCEVATMSNGECLGEMALLSGAPRSATVIAATSLTLLKLTRQRFDVLLVKHQFLGSHLANILAKRFTNQEFCPEVNPHKKPLPLYTSTMRGYFSDFLMARKKLVAVLCGTAAASATFAWLLPGFGFSQLQATLSALLIGATILWAFDVFSYHTVAIALPVFIAILGLARPDRVFSGYANPSWFLLLGIFAISAAVGKTGLMYRLVLMLAQWFPKSYRGQTFALALSGLIMTPVIPSSNGRAVLAGPIIRDLCEMLKFRKGSPGAVGMAMAGLLGFGQMSSLFMNGAATCLLALGLLPPETVNKISWGSWFLDALPLCMVYFIGCYVAIIMIYRPKIKRELHKSIVRSQLHTLGAFTQQEKICLLTIILALLGFIGQSLHGIHNAWIAMASFLILAGSKVLDERSVRSDIDWNFLLSFGAIVSFGSLIAESGLTNLVATRVAPYIKTFTGSPFLFLPTLALTVTIVRFTLPLPVALLISILSIVPVAKAAGINPFIVAQVALIAGSPWFTPYQNSVYVNLMESSDNKLFTHRQTRILAFWQLIVIVLAIIVAIPIWKLSGLIQ